MYCGLLAHVRLVEGREVRSRDAGEEARVPWSGRVRRVRSVRREVHEDRLARRRRGALDEVHGLAEVDVRPVVGGSAAIRELLAVLVEVVAVLAVRVAPDGAVPLVPAGRDVERVRRVRIAVQVLAEEGGSVAGPVEERRDRGRLDVLVVRLFEAAGRQRVPEDPGVVRVLAAEDRRPGRAAERERDHVVRERRAPGHEKLLQVRHVREHPALDVLVIRQDQDDVRRAGRSDRAPLDEDGLRPDRDRAARCDRGRGARNVTHLGVARSRRKRRRSLRVPDGLRNVAARARERARPRAGRVARAGLGERRPDEPVVDLAVRGARRRRVARGVLDVAPAEGGRRPRVPRGELQVQ